MNQVVFAAGKLWAGVNTVVKTENGITHVGIPYFIVTPSFTGSALGAVIANQGYLSASRRSAKTSRSTRRAASGRPFSLRRAVTIPRRAA
jgi:hypothetical protein